MLKSAAKVLLVDDDQESLRLYARALASGGNEVQTASTGEDAMSRFTSDRFDVVVSDVMLPGMDGIELLRSIRLQDGDVPVILMSSRPDVSSAMQAVEHGALKYVAKPIDLHRLLTSVAHARQRGLLARLKREALSLVGQSGARIADRSGLASRYAAAVRGHWVAFHPIVSWSKQRIVAYEALLRSTDGSFAGPGAIVEAAEELDLIVDLGRTVRSSVAAAAEHAPDDVDLFVNVHPGELFDDHLTSRDSALAPLSHRVVLEITERASLASVRDLASKIATLRDLGYRLAVDDLGAGYSGLTNLAQIRPEVVKLDMALIRGVDDNEPQQQLVRSILQLCKDMGVEAVAEGIETPAERDVVVELGCDLLQGFLFAKPERDFPNATF